MSAHDLNLKPLLTTFGTTSLITLVKDTLARKQIFLMLHNSCQGSSSIVMHCRFSLPFVS